MATTLTKPAIVARFSRAPSDLFTDHRIRVAIAFLLSFTGLYVFQYVVWPRGIAPHGLWQAIYAALSLLWLAALLPGILCTLGVFMFRHPEHLHEVKPIRNLVVWRIVSRGTNVGMLVETINRVITEMERTPMFRYSIEVVLDTEPIAPALPHNRRIRYIVVPEAYQTPHGSRFKARALHYATLHSEIPDEAWLVHLDEETQPTASGIRGIAQMIQEEEASGRLRIGQGPILYHRTWRQHWFLTLADNIRTGDDFARFYFQHRLGRTIFGLHGSYIVVRNDIEKAIGFDFGPKGSITEDAFFALVLMEAGGRARWVDGYLEEQSTQSAIDFMKQRRRWYQGLVKVSLYAPVKLRWRLSLGINTILWTLTPYSMLYSIFHLFYGFSVSPVIQFLGNYAFSVYIVLYYMGLVANMDAAGIQNPFKRLGWTLTQVVLMPIFGLLEAGGVGWALLSRSHGFHVVTK